MTRTEIARRAEDILSKFNLTANTATGEDYAHFQVVTAGTGEGGSVWLYPQRVEFFGGKGAILIPVDDMEKLANQYLPSERERFVIALYRHA